MGEADGHVREVALPEAVRAAFGVDGAATVLDGGQGTSVGLGDLVLKPDSDETAVAWFAGLCARVTQRGFRLAEPVLARDGRLVVDGWSASRRVLGCPVRDDDRAAASWSPVLRAGLAFHRAVDEEPAPPFLEGRRDRWALADRAAWGELDVPAGPRSAELLPGLQALVVDEGLRPQLVHGDLSGNVLLHGDEDPAVIDVSPYWRPPDYARAVVVVDACLWWRTDVGLIRAARPDGLDVRRWVSLLARAGTFRLLSFAEPQRSPEDVVRELPRYVALVRELQDVVAKA